MLSGSEAPARLFGPAAVGLVGAVAALAKAGLRQYAVIGGVAVTARLGHAHRATTDVDTVVDESIPPDAVAALLDLPGTKLGDKAHRVLVDGTKIEIRGVDRLDLVHPDLGDLTYKQQLFVVAHRWALDTATPLTVEGWKDNIRAAVTATAPFAIPAALLAMKLHAIEDRSNGFDQTRKRGGDAWDMHQLLTRLDANGSVRAQLALAPPVVRGLVSEGLERVFIARKNLTAGWMRAIPQAAGVTGDELALPAESVLVALS